MRNNRKRAATKESPPQNKQQENSGGEGENVDGLERGRRADGGFGANCEGQKSQQKCWGQMGEEEGGEGHMEEKIENNGRGDGIVGPQLVGVAPFNLSWRVEWSGTFPVGKISAENVAKRLDSLIGPSANGQQKRRLAGTESILAISPNGVIAMAVDNPKTIFLSHPIRKVCCVVGRVETRQLAYITREQPSHSGHHIPYRKQCHVFRTETAFEVEEIESVLSSAFQQALSQDSLPLQMVNSPSPKLRLASASVRDVATSPLHLDLNPSPLKTPKKDKGGGFLERSRSQMRISSSSLIQKIFGTPKKQQKSPEFKKPPLPSQPNQNDVRFRKPRWPLTPLRSCTSSTAFSTPKRPMPSNNDGFLQPPFPAPPPFQSSTMIDAKRNSAASNNSKFATQQRFSSNSSNHSPPNKQNCIKNDGFLVPSGPGENLRGATNCAQIELVYDERLKEWIYPMDECMGEELERLAYFCGPNEKDYVMDQLRRMPIGHFMLRLSGSRRKCLALSVRVEENEANPKGIAHYLVIRNEQGYRIRGSKRYFQSLPMLVTHHSVLAEQLPCRLKLSDWRWIQEPQMMRRRQSSGGSTLAALRGREEAADPTTIIRWRKPPMGGFGVQNCRQIEPRARMTSSTLFSSKSSTILSA